MMNESVPLDKAEAAFLADGTELGRLIARFDWGATGLGPIESWPQVVKTTVGLILRSPVPIVTLWGEAGVMIYNDAYSVFAGARHPEILGRDVLDAWPEVADWNANVMEKVLRQGETLSFQDQELTLYRNGRGELVWMNLDYSRVVDDDGRAAGVIAIVVETSEKVRAERHLSSEHQRLAQMFDEAPGFMAFLAGPDHVFTMANRAYEQLVGGRGVVGKPVAAAIPEVSAQGFVELLDRVYATGEPFIGHGVPVTLASPDRLPVEKFVDFIYQPVTGPDGQIAGIFVQGHDTTSQQRAVQAIRESEERFRLVAERAPVMLWMGDPEGGCVYLNKAQREFWGVDSNDLDGFDWGDTVHEADSAKLYEAFTVAMSKQAPFTVEARYRRADGAYRMLETHAEPRLAPDGEFLGMIGVNVDVTEVREAQQRLEEMNATLEARVVEEIAERRVAEAALQQAQKMESIGKLTGGVAHDFNNLLQIIQGNLQLLESSLGDAPDDKARRRISNAMMGVERGAKLASQLLAFGRRQPLEPKVVNVGKLVTGMGDLLQRSIGEAVEVETHIAPGLWNAFVDPTQVENALLNLAINARDAMEGAGKLIISLDNVELSAAAGAEESATPGEYVMLSVADTGSGMSEEVSGRAFEPFFTTKPEGQGSGLGLSMVYGFAKQSGGHIEIDSQIGQGTTVSLYLPRVEQDEQHVAPAETNDANGGSETVLVVEDDAEVRATVTEMLANLGYRVVSAADVASAMAIVESGAQFDLLFTDVVMPGTLRPPGLARYVREKLPNVAVLFTSGYADGGIVHGGRLDPGVDLLPKPYTRNALAERVRASLNKAKRGTAA